MVVDDIKTTLRSLYYSGVLLIVYVGIIALHLQKTTDKWRLACIGLHHESLFVNTGLPTIAMHRPTYYQTHPQTDRRHSHV